MGVLVCCQFWLQLTYFCVCLRFLLSPVLCGRGKTSFNHVGNKRFRDAVNNALSDYLRASNRYEKSLVVHGIVDEIKSAGGRFLKNNYSTGEWFELPDQQAKVRPNREINLDHYLSLFAAC